jgi:hypothetical protein
MLHITIPGVEQWDEVKQEFITTKEHTLQLEHSLVSLSKWESKWCKPFLTMNTRTFEETADYIRCMTITQNVDPNVYNYIPDEIIEQVNTYINASLTATTINKINKSKGGSEQPTSELIYYWMIANNIPFECQKWHLSRLLTLIEVCSVKNQPPKKMSQREIMRQQSDLNAARRKKLNTRG